MIGALRGKLLLRRLPDLRVEAGGLCFELQAPLSIFDALAAALCHAHSSVRTLASVTERLQSAGGRS